MAELDPVPDSLRTLLEEEKAGGDPSRDARERVLLRLTGTFAGAGAVGASPNAGPHATSASGDTIQAAARLAPAARAVRAAVIFMTGAATGVGGYHLVVERAHQRSPVSAPAPTPAARPEVPLAPEPAAPIAPEPAPAASSAPTRLRLPSAPETTHGAPDRPDDPLAAERSLVEMARAALSRGQAERALTTLRRHARQFPNGELTEEREGLLVQALVGAQKYDQAREKAEQFKHRYPRSLFTPVIDQAIGSIP